MVYYVNITLLENDENYETALYWNASPPPGEGRDGRYVQVPGEAALWVQPEGLPVSREGIQTRWDQSFA